jgi:3-hydroxyacyl-[acyl-carrier-protein] dehydratase
MTDTFLLNDFYTVETSNKADDSTIAATIKLNANHDIFKGHFEQMPVMPGVCQTQLIKELLQEALGKNLTLTVGSNIKFTGMIIPTQHPVFNVELKYISTENQYVVDAQLFFENTIFTKFKGTFTTR